MRATTHASCMCMYSHTVLTYTLSQVSAFPMHGLCGIWGLLFTGLLAKEQFIVDVYGKEAGKHLMGIFYGGHGQLLLCQVGGWARVVGMDGCR